MELRILSSIWLKTDMSRLNRGNMGFDIMFPTPKEKEVLPTPPVPVVCNDHKITLFGLEFRFLFSITSLREKD